MASSKSNSAHCNKTPGSCSRDSAPNQPCPSESKQTADKKGLRTSFGIVRRCGKQKKKHALMASSKSNSAHCNKAPGSFSRDSAHCNKAPCSCSRDSTPNQPFPSKSKQTADKKKPARKHCYRGKVRQTKNETHLHGYPNGRSCFPTGFVALTTNSIECRLEARPMLQEITSPGALFFRRRSESDAAKNF